MRELFMMKQHHNRSKGFYIYGRNVVRETVHDAPDRVREVFIVQGAEHIDDIIADARAQGIRVTKIDQQKAQKLFGNVHAQGIGAYYAGYVFASWSDIARECDPTQRAVIVIVDGVEDVQNYGAIIRSAAAVGARAVCVPAHKQAPINQAVFATAAGTVHKVPIVQFSGTKQMIADVKNDDFWVYGIDMSSEGSAHTRGDLWAQDFDGNSAIVVGAEGRGIAQKVREHCDFITSIPMEDGVESLNVSVATGVVLYEWKRQSLQK